MKDSLGKLSNRCKLVSVKRALIALAVLLAACDSTGPDPIAGEWQLESWNGQSLPAIYYGTPETHNIAHVSETISFSPRGTYVSTVTERYQNNLSEPFTFDDTYVRSGIWSRGKSAVTLNTGVSATMVEGRLQLNWGGDGTVWSYKRP